MLGSMGCGDLWLLFDQPVHWHIGRYREHLEDVPPTDQISLHFTQLINLAIVNFNLIDFPKSHS